MPGFFERKDKVSAAIWATGTIALLIPTSIKLSASGNRHRNAESDRNRARGEYDAATDVFDAANRKLKEAEQRIIDLDCAIPHYSQFNDRMAAFSQRFNGTSLPADQLSLIWNVNFVADVATTDQSVLAKSAQYLEYNYGYYHFCSGCDDDDNCCMRWGWKWEDKTYYYNEITTVQNQYKNILVGAGANVLPLNCGYYSREFAALSPESYQVSQSEKKEEGDPRAGTTYVSYSRQFGSRVPLQFRLDDTQSLTRAVVPRDPTQAVATTNTAARLYQFLIMSMAAFSGAGTNYTNVQQGLQRSIPGILNRIQQANETVTEKAGILLQKQTTLDKADADYQEGLSLWLPLFFLVPGGLALLYLAIYYCCKQHKASAAVAPQPSIDLEARPVTVARKIAKIEEIENTEEELPPPAYSLSR